MDRIETKADVCDGKPVIRGTRISVSTILSYLSAGDSLEEVIETHPEVSREDVLACLNYAKRLSDLHTLVDLAS